MKAVVIYDTLYGNTEKIAQAIAGVVAAPDTVGIVKAGEATMNDLEGVDVLFIGSPTQGGRATRPMLAFLDKIPEGALKNMRVAPFDTRLKTKLVKMFGYAAGRIEDVIKEKGGSLTAPGLFLVKGNKGPLVEGEEERAGEWARGILKG